MTIGERIYELRRAKFISQDELADIMQVSRQSVSKWETDQSYPEIDKLVKLADYFQVTTDYLIKGEEGKPACAAEPQDEDADSETAQKEDCINISLPRKFHYEYKSKKTIGGLPLVHINVGAGIYKAKGIIAIGNIAQGIVAIGPLAFGLIAHGAIGFGLISFSAIAFGLLLALGGIAVSAFFAAGGVAIGLFMGVGGLAIGIYRAIGGLAISRYPTGGYTVNLLLELIAGMI